MISEIKDGDKTVGYYTFGLDGEDFAIEDLQIYEEFQGKGYCKRLLIKLVEIHGVVVLKNVKNSKVIGKICGDICTFHVDLPQQKFRIVEIK